MDNATLEQLANSFDVIYKNRFNEIYYNINSSRQDYTHVTAKQQAKLKSSIDSSLKTFQDEYISSMEKTASRLLDTTIKRFEMDSGVEVDYDVKQSIRKKVDSYLKEQSSYVKNQSSKMRQDYTSIIKQDALLVSRNATVQNTSKRKVYDDMKSELFIRNVKSHFVDRLGRKYDSSTYYEMLTKTILGTLRNTVYTEVAVEYGYDLVRISSHNAKDACRAWEGKVLSLTGATKGYITVAQAKGTNQVFHPRCRHYYTVVKKDEI